MALAVVFNQSQICAHACAIKNGNCMDKCILKPNGEPSCECFEGRSPVGESGADGGIGGGESGADGGIGGGESAAICEDSKSPPVCGIKSGKFACSSGQCIDFDSTCDGVSDCLQGDDENPIFCSRRKCPKNYFKCENKACVPKRKICDRRNDCGDLSDERNCNCSADEFRCKNGFCIPVEKFCDHSVDCPDGSDEFISDHCRPKKCQNGFLPCNSTTLCVRPDWICDGQDDCRDLKNPPADEENCSGSKKIWRQTCPTGYYSCLNGHQCIPFIYVCDRDRDCVEGDDELGCSYDCDPNLNFQCGNAGKCIKMDEKCDGKFDCADKSDELDCQNTEAPKFVTIPSVFARRCNLNDFVCNSSRACIPREFYCDGEPDCQDQSDEPKNCKQRPCRDGQFQCKANKRCIPVKF